MPDITAATDDPGHHDFLRERRQILGALLFICAGVAFVLIFTAHALADTDAHGTFLAGFALLVAAASFAVGGMLGFLFGVPREASGKDGSTQPHSVNGRFTWNSNLVELSDWMTKMLVGVGLTQLMNVPKALDRGGVWLAASLAPVLPAAVAASGLASKLAICIVVFYSVMGLIIGHLVTQLWLFRAYSLARVSIENAIEKLTQVRVPLSADQSKALASGGVSATSPSGQNAEVAKAAEVVRQRPQDQLKTPADYALQGVALALGGNYGDAVAYLQLALVDDPFNRKYLTDLGRALIGARKFSEAIPRLEEAFKLARKSDDRKAQSEIAAEIMFAGLYAADRSSIDKTIMYGEQFADITQGQHRALINRFLACAYGQKYSYNKGERNLPNSDSEQVQLRTFAFEALKRDLDALSGEAKEKERAYLRSLMLPAMGSTEDDLKDFAEFDNFKKLLGDGKSLGLGEAVF